MRLTSADARSVFVFALFLPCLVVGGSKKQDYIERVTELKEFKKLLSSRLNVLVVFSNRDILPNTYYSVLSEVADLARGIGTVLHVNCDKGAKLCKKRKVNPTGKVLIHHYKESSFKKEYDRSLNTKSMLRFLKDPEGDVPWDEDNTANDVVHIETPSAFDKLVRRSELPVLVMFYAPWCGHCKRLKPEYAAAASEVKSSATLAAVDCVAPGLNVLQDAFNVSGFPTLLYFRKGKVKFTYGGAYTKDGLMTWLEDPAPPKEPEKEPEWSDEESEVVHLTDATFDEFMKDNPSVLVMFYAPWCGHCKAMKPDYTASAAVLKEEGIEGILAAVDATQNKKMAEKFEVQGFPTLKYFANGTVQYNVNQRTKDGLIQFMKDPTEETPEPADNPDSEWLAEESNIVHLEDSNFKSFLKKKKHVLVMFYAPWCGHCKNAKPHFINAAAKFVDNIKVAFAGVDCTVHEASCSDHGVRGYPTFKYFNYGKTSHDYLGGREEADFVKFMTDPSKQSAAPPPPPPPGDEFKGHEGQENVVQLGAEEVGEFIKDSDSALVMFYAPWCGHCKRMIPDYAAAAKELSEFGMDRVIAAVDATLGNVATSFEVKGFPTIRYYQNGEFKQAYEGGRSKDAIVNFMKGSQPAGNLWENVEGEQNVAKLTEQNFDQFVGKNPSVLVMFYSPSCGGCKRLKVPFAAAATKISEGSAVGKLAAVDATQEVTLATQYSINNYPTLLYFKEGSLLFEYQSERGESDLVSFMEGQKIKDQKIEL